MQSEHSKKYITVETKTKNHQLTVDEYSRWICLLEALEHVNKKAAQMKVDLKDVDWVKPLSFQKYITERFDSMVDEVELFDKSTITNTPVKCTTLLEPASK
jgi:hypothetical protein